VSVLPVSERKRNSPNPPRIWRMSALEMLIGTVGKLGLIDNRWEPLQAKPDPGQWRYFETE
jgi:hypothetical protein